jgi:hypothetical protein
MFCPECGHEMPGRPAYCRSCGHRIEYPGDQDNRPIRRASRARITLRYVISFLTVTVVLLVLLLTAAAVTANIILPDDIHYSRDGRCDVCGTLADTVWEVDGSIEHEFCLVDAVVWDMTLPTHIQFDWTYPNWLIELFSKWLFLIAAVWVAVGPYGDLTGLSRDPGKTSRQVYRRGIVSVAVGLIIWLIAGCLCGLSAYHANSELFGGPTLESLGTVQVLRIASLPFGFFWCSLQGWYLLTPGGMTLLRWSKDRVLSNIRAWAITFAPVATLCMVSSTVLGRGYLAGSIFVMSVGIFMLVLGFWPVRDSATHLPSTM